MIHAIHDDFADFRSFAPIRQVSKARYSSFSTLGSPLNRKSLAALYPTAYESFALRWALDYLLNWWRL